MENVKTKRGVAYLRVSTLTRTFLQSGRAGNCIRKQA
jgi:hypothetical protein